MQAMRNAFLFFSAIIVLMMGVEYLTSSGNAIGGISQDSNVPANIQPIELMEIQRRLEGDKEVLLFLYASWCPYCHKQLALIQALPLLKREKILAVSIDRNAADFSKFVAEFPNYPVSPRIFRGDTQFMDYLKSKNSQFTGGIPYLARFSQGELREEFLGLTSTQKLFPTH